MSSWEERMAAKAHRRYLAEVTERERREAAEHAAYEAAYQQEVAEQCAAAIAAGPPCPDCNYFWHDGYPGGFPWGPHWFHGGAGKFSGPPPPDLLYAPPGVPGGYAYEPGDWCWHSCHGDGPAYVGPVWIG